MKGKIKRLATLCVLFVLFAVMGVLAACNKAQAAKPSEFVDGVNYYYGDGKDMSLQGWFASKSDAQYSVTEQEDGSVRLHYYNDSAWRNFGVSVEGKFSDFSWLNISMKSGETPVGAFVKIVNPIRESVDNPNVLGQDIYFDLTGEYTTYAFKVPGIHRQILDVVNDICLFPDPGTTGTYGDIYVKRAWFSAQQPEESVWMNEEDAANAAGWTAESWTGYSLRKAEGAEIKIGFSSPAEWAGAFRPVELPDEKVNKLTFVFSSDTANGVADSIDNIVFSFRGDEASWNNGGWWNYYEQRLHVYHKGDVPAGEDGNFTLEIPIGDALKAMQGQHEKQLLLGLNIESCPEFDDYDGKGQITIKSVTVSYDENFENPEKPSLVWGVVDSGKEYYKIEDKDGYVNVTYKDVPADRWCNLYTDVPAALADPTVKLTLRNNGAEPVKFKFSLDSTKAEAEQFAFLQAKETRSFELTTDKRYSAISLFLDCCYDAGENQKEKYSGNVDIVSVEFGNEAPMEIPVENWRCDAAGNPYTISKNEDGSFGVAYSASPQWTNILTDFVYTPSENTALTLRVKNNNAFEINVRFDLQKFNEQGAWTDLQQGVITIIAAGETKSIIMNIAAGSPVAGILGFIDMFGSAAGSVTLYPLEASAGAAPSEEAVALTWGTAAPCFTLSGEGNSVIEYAGLTGWQNVNAELTLKEGQTSVKITLVNHADHKVKYKLSGVDADWQQIGEDSSSACAWQEVEAGATQELTIVFSAEQAPLLAHLMLMIDCWGDGAEYGGSTTVTAATVA